MASVVPFAGTNRLVSSFVSSDTCARPVRSSSLYVPAVGNAGRWIDRFALDNVPLASCALSGL